jgi:hypothetical protein
MKSGKTFTFRYVMAPILGLSGCKSFADKKAGLVLKTGFIEEIII